MKIAILVNLFPPKWLAGTEIATYYLAQHLTRRGHEVHVITSLDEGLPEEICENGIHIRRLPRIRVRFVGVFAFWAAIIRTIRMVNPDIVHAQSLYIAIPALVSKRFLKIPYLVWGRGSDVYLPNRFTKLTAKTILKNADSVLALTKEMKRVMQVIYDREIAVVPNGIDLNEYTARLPAREVEGCKKRILFVGRLHPVKGVQYLLQAMKIVHEEMPEARLILVGDGEERDILESLTDNLGIRGCVEFVGKVPHEMIPDYMYHADVFVLPSLSESFGIVNLEAMACGLPIVATRVGGLPDVIEDGVNGYLVGTREPREIAERLLMVMQNDEMQEEISTNNREKAKLFTWENVAIKVEMEYQKAIARSIEAEGANLQRDTTERSDIY